MSKFELINDILKKLPVTTKQRHMYMRRFMIADDFIRNKGRGRDNISVVRSNSDYGHEYWLKRYAGWDKCIYGLIEHGLYLGRNSNMVGLSYDYEFKQILTFGDYREEVLREAFPSYKVYKIGPRIAYIKTDYDYLEELKTRSKGRKVLTLFPFHSSNAIKASYDVPFLVALAKKAMKERGLGYLQVCLPYADIRNGNAKAFSQEGCDIVSAGRDSINFLPKLRAIIEASDLTMSNSLGTNLGYCIYMGKMQILVHQDHSFTGADRELYKELELMHSKNSGDDYRQEEKMFQNIFGEHSDEVISTDQYQLCDYYWGYSYVKSANEMYNLLDKLYNYDRTGY